MLPTVTLEEHFVAPAVRNAFKIGFPEHVMRKLSSWDERLHDMDKGGVTVQVVSHAPTAQSIAPDVCQQANKELLGEIKAHEGRYAGFAILPMHDPEAACKELEHCVKEYGFVGSLVNNHANGRFYDDEYFWPIFAKAQELDGPIYIHPTFAPDSISDHYKGNYSNDVAMRLSMNLYGWHAECGIHILRMFASGFFDKHPKVKIIIGHMGENLPYMLDRIQYFEWSFGKQIKRPLREVWDTNIWITTAGMFSTTPMATLLRATKIERILYSVDYPFAQNEDGAKFIEDLEKSGMVTEKELEMIAHGNATRLLKLRSLS